MHRTKGEELSTRFINVYLKTLPIPILIIYLATTYYDKNHLQVSYSSVLG